MTGTELIRARLRGAHKWLRDARTPDERHLAESEILRLRSLLQDALDHDGPRGTGSAEPSAEI